jgi:hypothetical protein
MVNDCLTLLGKYFSSEMVETFKIKYSLQDWCWSQPWTSSCSVLWNYDLRIPSSNIDLWCGVWCWILCAKFSPWFGLKYVLLSYYIWKDINSLFILFENENLLRRAQQLCSCREFRADTPRPFLSSTLCLRRAMYAKFSSRKNRAINTFSRCLHGWKDGRIAEEVISVGISNIMTLFWFKSSPQLQRKVYFSCLFLFDERIFKKNCYLQNWLVSCSSKKCARFYCFHWSSTWIVLWNWFKTCIFNSFSWSYE